MNDIRPCGNNEKWCENCVSKGKCDYTRSNMTRQEAIKNIKEHCYFANLNPKAKKALDFAVKTLEQEPCDDCISRQEAINCATLNEFRYKIVEDIKTLPSVTPKEKIGYCKDCKWWKDSDGAFRRGIGAESKCPINCKKVYEGNGYCFMFEPQESEVSE